jgi:outer membrane receptor protein involved in Fe transport
LSVWAKNLTDELLVSGQALLYTPDCRDFTFQSQSATLLDSYQPPRTFGATLRWNFAP